MGNRRFEILDRAREDREGGDAGDSMNNRAELEGVVNVERRAHEGNANVRARANQRPRYLAGGTVKSSTTKVYS